ncbi:hypothetical protein ABIC03_007794 [Bradyrhizobium sp. RT6a]
MIFRGYLRRRLTYELLVQTRVSRTLGVDEEDPCVRSKTSLTAQARVGSNPQQPRQTNPATFTRNDSGVAVLRIGQKIHGADCVLVIDSHKRVGRARKDAPSNERSFVAFEHRHYGRLPMSNLSRMSGSSAFKEARCG